MYDLIVIGAGPAGMISALFAHQAGKRVLLLEKMPKLGLKLKASGGGKCNVTNTLDTQTFIEHFGRQGRFIQDAIRAFSAEDLRDYLNSIGVQTHAPDGFRVFPTTHNSETIVSAFIKAIEQSNIEVLTNTPVVSIDKTDPFEVQTAQSSFSATNLIIATGGKGYEQLGSSGDGLSFAESLGLRVTNTHPAMMPLLSKELWVANCRADTIANAILTVPLKEAKKLKMQGDLIFTKRGIRGPVVLDIAKYITPLLDKYGDVPLKMQLTSLANENAVIEFFKAHPELTLEEAMHKLFAPSIANELMQLCKADANLSFKKQAGSTRNALVQTIAATPLTIIGHDGFKEAMTTTGGVAQKEIDPKTMMSRSYTGLFFVGEVVDIDGPCGGYNLQWCFSSGVLAARNLL